VYSMMSITQTVDFSISQMAAAAILDF